MRKLYVVIALLCALALTGCAQQGIVEHDGTELTPAEHASLYQSREEEHPDPELTEKRTVYYTQSGTKYHLDPECTYLQRANTVYSGSVAEAANHGADSPCSRCAKE